MFEGVSYLVFDLNLSASAYGGGHSFYFLIFSVGSVSAPISDEGGYLILYVTLEVPPYFGGFTYWI